MGFVANQMYDQFVYFMLLAWCWSCMELSLQWFTFQQFLFFFFIWLFYFIFPQAKLTALAYHPQHR